MSSSNDNNFNQGPGLGFAVYVGLGLYIENLRTDATALRDRMDKEIVSPFSYSVFRFLNLFFLLEI